MCCMETVHCVIWRQGSMLYAENVVCCIEKASVVCYMKIAWCVV